jgi:hypothetical protein
MIEVAAFDELAAFEGRSSWEDDEVAALKLLKVKSVESNADNTLTTLELDIKEDVWPEVMLVKSACELEAVEDFK